MQCIVEVLHIDFDRKERKQNALGFTPENVTNKKTTLSDSDVDYPNFKSS